MALLNFGNFQMWILTFEVNDYDQYGEYFLAAWPSKPSEESLEKILKARGGYYTAKEVLDNVGRSRPTQSNDEWYSLFKYNGD